MAINALSMGIAFTARDLASGVIARISTRFKALAGTSEVAAARFTKATGALKSGAILLGAGLVGLGVLNRASKAFETFEVGLVTAGNVMNATTTEMNSLAEAAIQAGIKTQFSPTEAIEGLRDLGAAGLNAATAIKVLNPVLDLAAASLGQLGVAQAGQIAVGVLNAFGETADKAAKRVDQLVRITQLTNFQARDFSVAISQASAQAKIGNQTFESMIATLGLLRNVNLDASSAATAYREAVRRVSGDQGAINKLIKLGVQPIDEQTKKMKDLGSIIAELAPKLQDLSATQKGVAISGIFGARGMKVFSAFMASHTKLVKEGKIQAGDFAGAQRLIVEELNNSSGAAAKAKDAFLKTAAGQRVLLKGSIETFKVLVGETITPVLLPALKGLVGALNTIIGVFRGIPGPIKDIIANFAGFAAAGLAVAGAIKVVGAGLALLRLSRFAASAAAATTATTGMASQLALMSGGASTAAGSVSRLGRVVSGIGRALPIVAVGVAAFFAIRKTLQAGERRLEALRKKRAAANLIEQKRVRDAFIKTASAAAKVQEVAARAADMILKQAGATTKLAKKSLRQLEKNLADRTIAGEKAALRLFDINRELALKGTSIERRRALNTEKIKLRQQQVFAQARAKVEAATLAQIEGEQARRGLSRAKNAKEFQALLGKFAAGRFIKEQKLAAEQRKLQERLESIRGKRLPREKARLRKSIALLAQERKQSLAEVERFIGIPGGGRQLVGAFAKTTLAQVKERAAPGARIAKALPTLARGELPTGLRTQEQVEQLRRLVGTVEKQFGKFFLPAGLGEKLDRAAKEIRETGQAIISKPQIVSLEVDGTVLASIVIGGLERLGREGGQVVPVVLPQISLSGTVLPE